MDIFETFCFNTLDLRNNVSANNLSDRAKLQELQINEMQLFKHCHKPTSPAEILMHVGF